MASVDESIFRKYHEDIREITSNFAKPIPAKDIFTILCTRHKELETRNRDQAIRTIKKGLEKMSGPYENEPTSKEVVREYVQGSRTETEVERNAKELIAEDLIARKDNAKYRELKRKYDHLLQEFEEGEKRLDVALNIKEYASIQSIEPVLSSTKNEAVPIILLSDWHFEERVDPATINNLNEYNLEIAEQRWVKCIQNSLKLVHKERHSSDIRQALIWLGGDFITGYIHEELEESNYLSPTEATRFAKEKIITALKFYQEHGKFEKITVICNYGNHGRTNKKPRVSTGYKNSYEWMMYNDVADYFSGDKRFAFNIPNGLFAYASVLGRIYRFWHGDTVNYGGGIGGLTVPLIKAILRYNQQIEAEYNFMGHYHQNWQATKDCIVNGSGIGFNAYAQRIGASPEKPLQGFCICDNKYGITTKMSIHCE